MGGQSFLSEEKGYETAWSRISRVHSPGVEMNSPFLEAVLDACVRERQAGSTGYQEKPVFKLSHTGDDPLPLTRTQNNS